MTNNHHIIPKSDSPYAALNFPAGIPVLDPLPIQMSDDHLLWDLDFTRTSDSQFDQIARLVATARQIPIDEALAGIKAAGKFGICHRHVERVTGDDQIATYSVEQIEGMARSFRIKMLLTQNPIVLTLALTVLDAAALYCELAKATIQLAHGDPNSETALVVGEWSAEILRAVAADARIGSFRDRHDFSRLLALPTKAKLTSEEQYLVTTQIEAAIDGLDPDIEISVSVKPYTAYLAISCLQLRTRDPICGMLNEIRHYIRKLSEGITIVCPEAN